MAREPVAFLSYVRADDDHDNGRITEFRQRLEGEVRMQTGRAFNIFQDRNDISWGTSWQERIESSLAAVTFLIPIITPSFFVSPACRREFETFLLREKTLGMNRLILPIYYVTCDQLDASGNDDEIALILKGRNWTDWRGFRFKSLKSEEVSAQLANLASMIKSTSKDIDGIFADIGDAATALDLSVSDTGAESEVDAGKSSIGELDVIAADNDSRFFVSEARSPGKFDQNNVRSVRDKHQYYAYTKQFDEIIRASELADADEIMGLHKYISRQARRIQSAHKRKIDVFQDKLSKIDGSNAHVIFLCDNSGSTRGAPITGISCWTLIAAEALERASIRSEVLGFTTRAWKGGQSRELWLADGKPVRPGRLNDLRHIIYKSFDESVRDAAPNFGVMAREGLLKENIDGEAMLWAYTRFPSAPTATKIMIVLSDGAPVDDSTLSVNPGNFLLTHASSASELISEEENTFLLGIGVGHDVSGTFASAYSAASIDQLGPLILDALATTLLSASKTKG